MVDALNGDGDGGDVGAAVAVAGGVGEAVVAAVVGIRGVAAGAVRVEHLAAEADRDIQARQCVEDGRLPGPRKTH